MRKLVNGQIVNIKNIELFEKAAEHLAIGRKVGNRAIDMRGIDVKCITELTALYGEIYKSMPYPIYAIDDDIKYATIANCIKIMAKFKKPMWIEDGLYVCIDKENELLLYFVNDTWCIEKSDNLKEDNTNLDKYKDEVGYSEFIWVANQIVTKKSTANFYEVHMEDFIKACKNQPMVLKWELSNILNFGSIPNRIELNNNRILDLIEKNQYLIDIYVTGLRKTEEKQHVWNLFDSEETEPVVKPKYVKSFDFDVYRKLSIEDEDKIKPNADKLTKYNMKGLMSLFLTLCGIRSAQGKENIEDYTGFICDNNLVYEINNRVFVAKSNIYVEAKEIARGVKLYSYDRGLVYLVKSTNIAPGIYKENIYSYSINDGTLRLSKIQFLTK